MNERRRGQLSNGSARLKDFMADELTQLARLVAREQKVERTMRR